MSARRGRVFTPRWGQSMLKAEKRNESRSAQIAYLNRAVARANRAAGYDTAKKPATWNWTLDNESGKVVAHTRSEARAEIKKTLGIKGRLPVGIQIERANNV